jgi:hypothetical protein
MDAFFELVNVNSTIEEQRLFYRSKLCISLLETLKSRKDSLIKGIFATSFGGQAIEKILLREQEVGRVQECDLIIDSLEELMRTQP